jgi:hypothetical protein
LAAWASIVVEQRGLDRFKARVYSDFGHLINPWTRHLRDGVDWVRRALITAQTNGDLTFASFANNSLTMLLLASGEPLGAVQREVESGLEFTRRVHFGLFADIMTARLGLVRALRGQTADISSFGDEQFDERGFQQRLETDPRLVFAHVGTGSASSRRAFMPTTMRVPSRPLIGRNP